MIFWDKLWRFILSQAGSVDISEEFCQNRINIGSRHVPPCYRNLGNSSYCTLKKRSIFNSILVCLFNLSSLVKMFPKNHSAASINLFLVTFLIVALDIGEFLINTFLAHALTTKFGLGYGSFLFLSFLFFGRFFLFAFPFYSQFCCPTPPPPPPPLAPFFRVEFFLTNFPGKGQI